MTERYPYNRPYWVGQWQPWPCGRCAKEVDNVDPHECADICPQHEIDHTKETK